MGELRSTLAQGAGTLVRREVELASTELAGRARGAAMDVAMLGAGFVLPRTTREAALLGPARDRVRSRVEHAALGAAEAVEHLAERRAAHDEQRERGGNGACTREGR